MPDAVRLMEDPDALAAALSPVRRRVLAALEEPASATELAPRLQLARQKINYHLRVLERLGLVELAEVRQRRGCVERVMRRSGELVVDPGIAARPDPGGAPRPSRVAERDRHAAEHLIAVAGATVREVTRMQSAAAQRSQRLLTFTLETEVGFERPGDVHAFTDDLATALAEVVARHHSPTGRRYRLVAAGHPATTTDR